MQAEVKRLIDIIIPVYRNLAVTRRCIESVLASEIGEWANVIVIDDASPDPDVTAYCESLRGGEGITVLQNTENKGFVATVNTGMRLNPSHDVVLLNSDTEVAGDWLQRMQACAYRSERIATVTPFSNNATICSYPKFVESNELPEGYGTAQMHALFATANDGLTHEIPTAVGFCMYIRRDCLDDIGFFDEASFGKGYGEECDFSMRAIAAGWTNQLAADVFVFHEGSVSFGDGARDRKIEAEKVMARKHPSYTQQVSHFIACDPLQPYRHAVDTIRVVESTDEKKIAVCLAAYNGMRWLPEQVASILAQTGVAVSLFISVDKSTDGTAEWVQQKADRYSNVTLLSARVGSASASQNFFRLCRDVDFSGFDYIGFADQDDEWLPEHLEKAIIKLLETRSDGYSSNVTAVWDATGKTRLIEKSQAQVAWDFLFESPGPGCTFVVTQSLVLQLQSFLQKNKIPVLDISSHDWFIYAYARAAGYKWCIDSEATILYRQHDRNLVGANQGWRAGWRRWQEICDGRWRMQISRTIDIIGVGDAAFIKRWYPFSRRGFLRMARQAKHCRRRRRDKVLLALIATYWAITVKR